MPPTLTEIDKWLVVSPFTLLWQAGGGKHGMMESFQVVLSESI